MRKRIAILIGASMLALVPAQVAHAEETVCTGFIGAQTHDNIRVPEGATCTLEGTIAQGTVIVETGATLRAFGVHVNGNVQAEGARSVNVTRGSFVGGSIQVVQGGSAVVRNSEITMDILFDENSARLLARSNQVGGNVQAFQNTGGVAIIRNVVDGNLQCKENVPAPTGGGNIVQGNKEDQCANL